MVTSTILIVANSTETSQFTLVAPETLMEIWLTKFHPFHKVYGPCIGDDTFPYLQSVVRLGCLAK